MANLSSPGAGDNTAPELFTEFYGLALAAKRKKDEAAAEYLHLFKRAKSAGVNIDVLKRVMKAMKVDPDELRQQEEQFAKAMVWIGRPVGTQLDIEDVLKPSQRAKDDLERHKWFQEGYEAGRSGQAAGDCLYPAGGAAHIAWAEGHSDGVRAAENLPKAEAKPRKPRKGKQGGAPEGATVN